MAQDGILLVIRHCPSQEPRCPPPPPLGRPRLFAASSSRVRLAWRPPYLPLGVRASRPRIIPVCFQVNQFRASRTSKPFGYHKHTTCAVACFQDARPTYHSRKPCSAFGFSAGQSLVQCGEGALTAGAIGEQALGQGKTAASRDTKLLRD